MMPAPQENPPVTFSGPAHYQIIVDGPLDESIVERLGSMTAIEEDRADGTLITVLAGRIADQGELNGVMNALYDLHVPIISILASE